MVQIPNRHSKSPALARSTIMAHLSPPDDKTPAAAIVGAKIGEATGQARIRIVPPLPWKFDFNDIALKPDPNNPNAPPSGEAPVTWIGARYRHKIIEKDGDKVMVKITTIPKGTRSQCWFGPDDMHDYTIQADLRGQHHAPTGATMQMTSVASDPSVVRGSPDPAQVHGCFDRCKLGNNW